MTKSPIKLPPPVFDDPKHHIRLYQGDCLDLLALIPESSVDLVFADPPYFLSNGGITCHAGRMVSVNKGDWDKSKGPDLGPVRARIENVHDFNRAWLAVCQRVLKPMALIAAKGTYIKSYRHLPRGILRLTPLNEIGGCRMEASQPLLRWAGSKRQIVPLLSKYWSGEFKRYVEPFAGSACLFFHLAPRTALLGDINAELLSTYQSVKVRYSEVSKLLCKMPKGELEYYKVRTLQPEGLSPAARAARFIYLNRYCFNGLYRTNRNGDFNVPYGGRGSGSIPSAETLKRISSLLRRATLINDDFEKVLDRVKHGDFVYMDPPFSVRDRRVFKEYGSKVFGWNDIIRLRKRLVGLAEMRIPFVVSYIRSEEAEYLAKGFKVSSVSVRRNISGFLESRIKCQELLISNPA